MRASVCVCVRACVCARTRLCVCVRAGLCVSFKILISGELSRWIASKIYMTGQKPVILLVYVCVSTILVTFGLVSATLLEISRFVSS